MFLDKIFHLKIKITFKNVYFLPQPMNLTHDLSILFEILINLLKQHYFCL